MSIKSYVDELESIRFEMKTLRQKLKLLRQKEGKIENEIREYLHSKQQIGVKHKGKAIILEQKEKRPLKRKQEQLEDAAMVLEKYGIKDSQKVLMEILDARKQDKVINEKINIKKYKEK